jgi:hypothetical protein
VAATVSAGALDSSEQLNGCTVADAGTAVPTNAAANVKMIAAVLRTVSPLVQRWSNGP